MKHLALAISFFALTSAFVAHAQTSPLSSSVISAQETDMKEISFKVYGNCGMCKSRIQSAISKYPGVETAVWDIETKIMAVKYDAANVSVARLKKQIAKAGYDTEKYRALDETYNSLPGCCQYERPAPLKTK